MMSSEKMREEFEAWYDNERKKSAPYSTINMRDKCLEAWQASRAAMVVELPETFEKRDVQGLDYDKTVAAIEAAGVRVKS